MREWTITLPMTRPLSLNDRGNYHAKARAVAQLRKDAGFLARSAKVPALARFTAELHYSPKATRRMDPENLFATVKPFVDGLIDAGVAPDDTPTYYTPTVPVTEPANGKAGKLWVVVRELPS